MKTISPSIIHHEQNIKWLRKMLEVKQEVIAVGLKYYTASHIEIGTKK